MCYTINSSPLIINKSVFKFIFVLSNYQTCTFPLSSSMKLPLGMDKTQGAWHNCMRYFLLQKLLFPLKHSGQYKSYRKGKSIISLIIEFLENHQLNSYGLLAITTWNLFGFWWIKHGGLSGIMNRNGSLMYSMGLRKSMIETLQTVKD